VKNKKALYHGLACIGGHNLKAFVRSFNSCGQGLFVFVILLLFIGCDCTNPTTVTPPPYDPPIFIDNEAAWSPDGFEIAYYHAGVDSGGIYIINADGTNRRPFLLNSQSNKSWGLPDWSPDSKWLLLNELNSAQIFKIKYPTGDSLTQLTFSGSNFFPSWNSDGMKIAWDISTGDSIMGTWIMNQDGSDKKRVYPYGRMPDWLPGSGLLVYSGPSEGTSESQIWIMDTTGNNRSRITNFNIANRYPKASPDGSKIVFSSHADGSNPIKLTETGGDKPAWSPDGTKIVYCNTVNGHLWTMNSDGSNKKQLTF